SVGVSPLQRVIYTRFGNDPGHPNGEMGVAISTTDLFPELTGLRLQQEWRHSYGDPAPPSEAVVPLRQVIGGNMRRAVLLLHLAEAAGVNLIADDMGQSTNDDW